MSSLGTPRCSSWSRKSLFSIFSVRLEWYERMTWSNRWVCSSTWIVSSCSELLISEFDEIPKSMRCRNSRFKLWYIALPVRCFHLDLVHHPAQIFDDDKIFVRAKAWIWHQLPAWRQARRQWRTFCAFALRPVATASLSSLSSLSLQTTF